MKALCRVVEADSRSKTSALTGFDNRDQLRALEGALEALGLQSVGLDETVTAFQRELRDLDAELAMIDQLCALKFATIDLPSAEADLASSRRRLAALLAPDSDASGAKEAFDRANARVLEKESLPEKLDRFLEYLNRSSDQGVTQLLAGIAEDVDEIEQRIAELNRTLAKVEFQSGRYLRLQPERIRHERLRALETAQRYLRSAALKDDQGESHFKALQSVIEILRDAGENRRQLGSRALLDPRYRLQFSVVIVDASTGDTSAPRAGSQSGSGGEKELMASHILTASLSYALSPSEGARPLYASVVLDEAFSKSSPSAAGRIIEALRIFGLHPIFVTPNKEIGLLRRHTHRVVCVQRSGRRASLATISWEELAELADSSNAGAP